jgi:hypothetical protein
MTLELAEKTWLNVLGRAKSVLVVGPGATDTACRLPTANVRSVVAPLAARAELRRALEHAGLLDAGGVELVIPTEAATRWREPGRVVQELAALVQPGGRLVLARTRPPTSSLTDATPSLEQLSAWLKDARLEPLAAFLDPALLSEAERLKAQVNELTASLGLRSPELDRLLPAARVLWGALEPLAGATAGLAPPWLTEPWLGSTELLIGRRTSETLTPACVIWVADGHLRLEEQLGRVRELAPHVQHLVVDTSPRATEGAAARRAGARVLRAAVNTTRTRALGLALEQSLDAFAAVITLDAGDPEGAARIPELLLKLESADLVAVANSGAESRDGSAARQLAALSRLELTRLATGFGLSEPSAGARAYRTSMLRALPFDFESPSLPLDLLTWSARAGYRVLPWWVGAPGGAPRSAWRDVVDTGWSVARAFALGARRAPR